MNFLKSNAVKYGFIMTVLTGVWILLMHFTGQYENKENISGPTDLAFIFIVPLVVWYFGISARKKELGGKLSFKEGVLEGAKISLVYAVLSPFVYLKYYLFLNPEILGFIRSEYGLNRANDAVVILVDMSTQFVSAIIGGTIYAAIISFFLRSKSA